LNHEGHEDHEDMMWSGTRVTDCDDVFMRSLRCEFPLSVSPS